MNLQLAKRVLQEALVHGVTEFCLCPGARNAPFVSLLLRCEELKKYYWFEERSAAFFALGRSRASSKPVAIVTTSGTAAAELLPATMEAYYTGVPLLLITADRPRRFRGTGAPQTAEQVGLLGRYVLYQEDLADDDHSNLDHWDRLGPAHVNICFEEPLTIDHSFEAVSLPKEFTIKKPNMFSFEASHNRFQKFLMSVKSPLVVVGELAAEDREAVIDFLLKLQAPTYLEGISGIREDPRLASIIIRRCDHLWKAAEAAEYPIDSILRIGGIPTFRLWRDLEDLAGRLQVFSISPRPFTGLSWGELVTVPIAEFLMGIENLQCRFNDNAKRWLENDKQFATDLEAILLSEPESEASLIHRLSKLIPQKSLVYLGNSLPIREWNLAACMTPRNFVTYASRGLNGIDGQISTFLGLSTPEQENWAILGDLTALYDLAGPWIKQQLPNHKTTIVIVNNSGGQIFSRMYKEKEFLHQHNLSFEPLAAMWGMTYIRSTNPNADLLQGNSPNGRLIELIPDSAATNRFWEKLGRI